MLLDQCAGESGREIAQASDSRLQASEGKGVSSDAPFFVCAPVFAVVSFRSPKPEARSPKPEARSHEQSDPTPIPLDPRRRRDVIAPSQSHRRVDDISENA